MASFPGANPSNSTLWVAANYISNTLNGSHDNSTNIITVLDTTGFPSSGYVVADTEVIKYTSTAGTQFKNCTRGADGSAAASHNSGATAYHNWVADHHNVIKDEIIAIASNLTTRIGGHATQVQYGNGTVTNPAAAFQNSTGSGQYYIGANNIGFATNGVLNTQWKTTGFGIMDGTVTNPGLFFNSDTDTGIYRIGANQIGISTEGVLRANFSAAGFSIQEATYQILAKAGSAADPAYTFNEAGDSDTGFYLIGASQIGVSVNGTLNSQWNTTGMGILDGTVTNPGVFFNSGTGNGLYLIGANNPAMSTNGVLNTQWKTTGFGIMDGTVTNPGLFFNSDTDTGIYRLGAGWLNFCVGGVDVARFNGSSQIQLVNGTVTNPAYSFTADSNTGIYSVGADILGVSAGGVLAAQIEDPADLGATETSLWLYVDDDSAVKQVTTGADDSAGAGFKWLRTTN